MTSNSEQPNTEQDHLAEGGNTAPCGDKADRGSVLPKFTNDAGEVAVLYSPGFGAGWYTWSHEKRCLFDPEVVQWVLNGKKDAAPNVEDGRYGGPFYGGGMSDLRVAWLKPGTRFRIDEYDGSESLVVDGDDQWEVA